MLTTDQVLGKGRYRIISNFTQDETGGLYEAYDTVSNSNVVLRETVGTGSGIMTPAQLDEINSNFVGEAAALKEINHDALLKVQDYFSEIDRHYLVMEPVDGFDLTKFFRPEEKRPAIGDVMKWADQILAVLDHLHTLSEPFIHRDIRPANIRLTSNFKVKVLTSGLTSSSVIMASAGNPADSAILNYRPLEQLWGGLDPASQKVILNSYDDRSRRILQQPLDARSDLYSVGATLYHVVTRTLPKDALDRSIELLDGNSDPLVPPAEIDPAIPEAVSEVIMKAMELKREHRYDSASIMRQVLETAWKRSQLQKAAEPKQRLAPESLKGSEEKEESVELQTKDAIKPETPKPTVKEAKQPVADFKPQQEAEPIDDAFLLEVEPAKNADDDFEWSIDVSEQPVKAFTAPRVDTSSDLDFNLPAAPSSNMKFVIAGAGGLVLIVALLGWFLMGGSTKQTEPAHAQPIEAQQPAQQDQQPTAAFTDQNSANTSTDAIPLINETVTVEAKPESKQAKDKKPTPTPAKSEKKKVTVDDLINDN